MSTTQPPLEEATSLVISQSALALSVSHSANVAPPSASTDPTATLKAIPIPVSNNIPKVAQSPPLPRILIPSSTESSSPSAPDHPMGRILTGLVAIAVLVVVGVVCFALYRIRESRKKHRAVVGTFEFISGRRVTQEKVISPPTTTAPESPVARASTERKSEEGSSPNRNKIWDIEHGLHGLFHHGDPVQRPESAQVAPTQLPRDIIRNMNIIKLKHRPPSLHLQLPSPPGTSSSAFPSPGLSPASTSTTFSANARSSSLNLGSTPSLSPPSTARTTPSDGGWPATPNWSHSPNSFSTLSSSTPLFAPTPTRLSTSFPELGIAFSASILEKVVEEQAKVDDDADLCDPVQEERFSWDFKCVGEKTSEVVVIGERSEETEDTAKNVVKKVSEAEAKSDQGTSGNKLELSQISEVDDDDIVVVSIDKRGDEKLKNSRSPSENILSKDLCDEILVKTIIFEEEDHLAVTKPKVPVPQEIVEVRKEIKLPAKRVALSPREEESSSEDRNSISYLISLLQKSDDADNPVSDYPSGNSNDDLSPYSSPKSSPNRHSSSFEYDSSIVRTPDTSASDHSKSNDFSLTAEKIRLVDEVAQRQADLEDYKAFIRNLFTVDYSQDKSAHRRSMSTPDFKRGAEKSNLPLPTFGTPPQATSTPLKKAKSFLSIPSHRTLNPSGSCLKVKPSTSTTSSSRSVSSKPKSKAHAPSNIPRRTPASKSLNDLKSGKVRFMQGGKGSSPTPAPSKPQQRQQSFLKKPGTRYKRQSVFFESGLYHCPVPDGMRIQDSSKSLGPMSANPFGRLPPTIYPYAVGDASRMEIPLGDDSPMKLPPSRLPRFAGLLRASSTPNLLTSRPGPGDMSQLCSSSFDQDLFDLSLFPSVPSIAPKIYSSQSKKSRV